MAYKNLGEFIKRLESNGELIRISAPVDPYLEITEITDRISKGPIDQNKALLFEKVKGSDMPVLINSLGGPRRMAWALGVNDLNDLRDNLARLVDLKLPQGMGPALGRATDMLGALRSIGLKPKIVGKAPVQEVVRTGDEATLAGIPILTCWPEDGGPYVTMTTVISRDPVSGGRNVGMYRVQVYDERTVGMHWQLHKGGAEHERVAREKGQEQVPVAISLGGDPAVMWSGSAPLPPGIDEFLLAGWLRGKPVELVKCVSQPLEVPAEAEIVIEGYVDPAESRMEGPFGDHTGFYTPPALYPVLHITAVTHRRNPIYPTTIVGKPPMEDYWMGKATERLFLPLMKIFQGEIVDVNMPAAGVFHNLIFVSIKKRYPGHARKVINGLWGLGLMMLTKCIVIVDADVDVQNEAEAFFHMFGNVDWSRDVIIQDGPVDALDHGSHNFAFGGKMGVDATRKLPEEGYTRGWPTPIEMSEEVRERVTRRWSIYGF
ncbi:MAG: menaquinone biosynthesis decarboxylase [Caldilineales bacterium]|nr:menaquinone biosynthesis decarboxylase [Caldilineales bacterium]